VLMLSQELEDKDDCRENSGPYSRKFQERKRVRENAVARQCALERVTYVVTSLGTRKKKTEENYKKK